MKRKSKVTSIRVEPELYENFKTVLDLQGRQVSHVISGFLEMQIEAHNALEKVFANSSGLIKPYKEFEHSSFKKYVTLGDEIFTFTPEQIKDYMLMETKNSHIGAAKLRMYFTGVTEKNKYTFIIAKEPIKIKKIEDDPILSKMFARQESIAESVKVYWTECFNIKNMIDDLIDDLKQKLPDFTDMSQYVLVVGKNPYQVFVSQVDPVMEIEHSKKIIYKGILVKKSDLNNDNINLYFKDNSEYPEQWELIK